MNHSIAKPDCPTVELLAALIENGRTADPELVSHVDTCIECQMQLDRLTEPDQLIHYGEVARAKSAEQPFLGPPTRAGDLGAFGDFAIESEIGSGGMGVVYRARDDRLGRIVALKVLTCVASPTALARFDRESHAASSLNHPNIVPIYSAGQSDDGRPYLVMPLIEGDSLKSAIQKTSMSIDEIATWIRQIADGLHTAHQAGLIHRDVKPANILLDQVDNQAKLVDFGLVRGVDDQTLTRTEMMCGTPEYMSPEQANTETSDTRCDVYSLGITLYECLTGSVPFRGKPLDILAQHRDLEPVPPSRMNKSVPRDLETICLKAVQKVPGSRYLTAAEFASDLQSFLAGRPIKARPARVLEKTWRWAKRNRPLAASLSLLFMALLTGTIVSTSLWLRSERNAALAKSRNESLLASQKVLTDNQINLWETLRETYQRKTTNLVGPYSQMPTAVRNTVLTEMVVTYRLLFERGQGDRVQLRKMAEELVTVTEFALEHGMWIRASRLTELNREIVDQVLELPEQLSTDDLILAARVYHQFAEAQRQFDAQKSATAYQEAIRLAERASRQMLDDSESLTATRAVIQVFDSRRGMLRLASADNRIAAEKGLIELLEEVERSEKDSIHSGNNWRDLQQKIVLDLARTATGKPALVYRIQRDELLRNMLKSINGQDYYDFWLHRKHAVNLVMLGVTRDSLGQHQEAREDWSEALRLLMQLTNDSPTNSQYRADCFETMMLIANADWNANQREEALQQYKQAIQQFEITVQLNPDDPKLARRAAQVREMCGQRFLEIDRHQEAAESFRKGASHIQAMDWELQEDVAERDRVLLRDLLSKAADAFDSAGMPEQAEEARQELAAEQASRLPQSF